MVSIDTDNGATESQLFKAWLVGHRTIYEDLSFCQAMVYSLAQIV